jgi:hypothetical protein
MNKELIKAFLKDIIIKEGLTPDQSSKVMSKYDSIYKGMLKGDKKKLMKYTDPKFNRPNPDAMAMGRAINLVKKDSLDEIEKDRFAGEDPRAGSTIKGRGFDWKKNNSQEIVIYNGEEHEVMRRVDDELGKRIYIRPKEESAILGKKNLFWVKPEDLEESLNEARTDLEREYNQYDSFTLDGEVYMIKDIEEYPGNKVQITTEPSPTQDYLTGDSRKSKIFFSDKILKMGGEFHKKERKKRTTPAWNKGQKSTTRRQYERILKGAMGDAAGMGDEEFTYDMATSMIYDPEISSYLDKEYPRLGRNGKIERLQYDLEMYLQESVNEKKLTKAEKDKKEDIIMSMKKKKGGKDKLTDKDYAIATATAKKVAESAKEKSEKNYKSYHKNKNKNRLTELVKDALKNPKKADLDKDGKLSDYEKKRGAAIEKSMLKEYTDINFSGQDTLMRLDEPSYEAEDAFEEFFPMGYASQDDAADALIAHDKSPIKARMGQYAPMFVHVQYHEFTDEAGEKYRVHQTQYYNSNFKDDPDFNPRVTVLTLTKLADPDNPSPQSQKDIRLGAIVVKTDEYIKDLRYLEREGKLGKRVSEAINKEALNKIDKSKLAESILKKLREGKEERTFTVSKRRAKAEVKDIEKGKRSDGMGKSTAKVYAVKDGKEIPLKTLKDFNKHSSGYTYKLK